MDMKHRERNIESHESSLTMKFVELVSNTPTIHVDHRESCSGANAALQHFIKPFASLLSRGPKHPPGSPKLTPPKSAYKSCRIIEYQLEDTWVYKFSRSQVDVATKIPEPKHKLYYFAGGGFRQVATKEHWLLCAEICSKLPEYEVNLVSYPLAPGNLAPAAWTQMERLYEQLVVVSKSSSSSITLMGDSAGGNIALVLGIYGASQYLRSGGASSGRCPLQNILAICPAADLRNSNPEIDTIDPHDSILSRKVIEEVAEGWRGGWPSTEPRLSPVLADLSVFREAKIKVDGVIGKRDVLSPDAILFRKALADAQVTGKWLEWEKQMHCFPLMFSYHIHEAVVAKDWIVRLLRENAEHLSS